MARRRLYVLLRCHLTGISQAMKVRLHNPKREVEVAGPVRSSDLCKQLGFNRDSVLVIRDDELVTGDALLQDGDAVEIRPVISGGAG